MVTSILILIFVVLVVLMFRNRNVCRIRIAILNEDPYGRHDRYDMLPSYDYMFLHPTQWHMWTVGQYYRRYVLNNNS